MRLAALMLILLATASMSSAQNNRAASAPEISFTVRMSKPHTHLLEVEMNVRRKSNAPAPEVDLVMPVWTPGSYLIREYERHVQDFAATDAGGHALQWSKVNKNTWRVLTNGAREWRVSYQVYANELSVRTNELDDRHAFWNNAALLMYLDNFLNVPATLHVEPFAGWKVATGLPTLAEARRIFPNAVAGNTNATADGQTFYAENFDVLYDSPVEVGAFQTLTFEVKNVPHRIVIDGEGNYEPERLRDDVKKIVEAEVAMMGGEIPYRNYTFLVFLRSTGGGGLEHLNSTALIFRRFNFRDEDEYRSILSTIAHEYFHLWNVKRIRPDALGPFDYTRENYTKLLWVAEGLTEYYANVFLRRAGLIADTDYLQARAKDIQDLQNTPGRLEMSLEEASFDAWVKYYRQDENAVNSQISYYDKGAIVGLLLDLEIRRKTSGAKSLDDVMRALYTDFFKKGRNYTPGDFQRLAEQTAGASLDSFFSRFVRGRDELDYNAALVAAGLQLDTTGAAGRRPPTEQAFLGADLDQDNDRLLIKKVYAGAPAYDQGLNAGDQIVALDGMRVTRDSFLARIAEKRPGDVAHLTIFRKDDLRAFDIKLGARINVEYHIVPVPNVSAEQTRLYHDWLGESQK